MIDNLFGSKTRYKLLELFVSNPNRSFYVREITRQINEQINSVRRELSNLLSIGLIKSSSSNNKLYYEVNQKFSKYQALVHLFNGASSAQAVSGKTDKKDTKGKAKPSKADATTVTTSKVSGDEKILGNVHLVVLSGIFTRDKTAPADLLIVGDVTPASVDSYIAKVKGDVRVALFSKEEFDYRLRIKDKFIVLMLSSKLTVRVDRDNVVENNQ